MCGVLLGTMVPCLDTDSDKCECNGDYMDPEYSQGNRNRPSIPYIQKSRDSAFGWCQTKQGDPPQEHDNRDNSENRVAGRHRLHGVARRATLLEDVLRDQADSDDASNHASDDNKRELAAGHDA